MATMPYAPYIPYYVPTTHRAGECTNCGSRNVRVLPYLNGYSEVAERHDNGVQCSSRRTEYALCEACHKMMQGSEFDLFLRGGMLRQIVYDNDTNTVHPMPAAQAVSISVDPGAEYAPPSSERARFEQAIARERAKLGLRAIAVGTDDAGDDVPQPYEGPVRPVPVPKALSIDSKVEYEQDVVEGERRRELWARDQQRRMAEQHRVDLERARSGVVLSALTEDLENDQRQRDIALARERDRVRAGVVMRGLTEEERHMPLSDLVNYQLDRHRREDADAAAGATRILGAHELSPAGQAIMQGIHNELVATRDAALRHAISDSMRVERGELPEPPEPTPVVELPIAPAEPLPRRFKLHYD